MLFIQGLGSFLQPTVPKVTCFWIKKTKNIRRLKNISFKTQNFQQFPESIKKYFSKYDGCRSVIKQLSKAKSRNTSR